MLTYEDWDGTQMDVKFTQSTHGGSTWSAPVTMNDNVDAAGVPTDQFQPSVAAGPAGAVAVAFYDRRLPCPRDLSVLRGSAGPRRTRPLVHCSVAPRHQNWQGAVMNACCSGCGPVLAAVIVAEIGDIRRFPGPGQLASWAGLTPRHYESDTKVIRGHITKQGSRMLRWAVVEAIQRQPAGTRPRQVRDGIIARRGKEAKNIAKVAAARELLTLVFYGMRDGHVRRALQRGQAA